MLFEGPNGELLRQLTHSNGAEHLYRVDETTGKQTHVSHAAILASSEEQSVQNLLITDEQGVEIAPYAGTTLSYTTQESAPLRTVEDSPLAVDGVSTTLALAVVAIGGRNGSRKVSEWVGEWVNGARRKFDDMKQPRYQGRHAMSQAEKREKRKKSIIGGLALVTAALVLWGVTSCDNDEKPAPVTPVPTSSPGPEAPDSNDGVNDLDTRDKGKDDKADGDNADDINKETEPILEYSLLGDGGTVWAKAHDLLEARGYQHTDANTDAIKDALLVQMEISELEARRLSPNTKVPILDDDKIEDILDNFSNTLPNKAT